MTWDARGGREHADTDQACKLEKNEEAKAEKDMKFGGWAMKGRRRIARRVTVGTREMVLVSTTTMTETRRRRSMLVPM